MAWGEQGETKREDRDATLAEIENQSDCGAKQRFLACYKEGDTLRFQSEHDNHSGFTRFLGQSDDGFTYVWVVCFFMS